MDGLWDTPERQASSAATVGALQYVARAQGTDVELAEDVGTGEAPGRRTVRILPTASAPVLGDDGLQLPATADAATQLLQLVSTPPAPPSSLPLIASGGTLPEQVHFTVGDLHGWPEDLVLTLHTTQTNPPTASLRVPQTAPGAPNARSFTRVILNGVLLDMVEPRDGQHAVALPSALLRSDNTLELATVSAPPGETCARDGAAFSGPIDGSASLSWGRYGDPRAKLPELAARLHGQGALVLPDGSAGEGRAAARVLGVLNRWTSSPVVPTFATPEQLSGSSSSDYRLIFGNPTTAATPTGLPLELQPTLSIARRSTPQTPMLSGRPDAPFVALQYVAEDGSPLLLVAPSPGADDAVLDATFQRLTVPATFAALDGNVVLANATDLVVIDLTRAGLSAGATSQPGWSDVLSRYRWVLLLPISALIILFWVGVYRGVGQPLPPAVRPDNTPLDSRP